MKTDQKYQTAQRMRVALEERLNRMARDNGIDIMRLRRHVAFDRLLIRLFSATNRIQEFYRSIAVQLDT